MAAGSEESASSTGTGANRSRAERIPQGGTVEQAKEACLRLLAVRARSRAELAQRLAAKGFTPEITERALDRFTEIGLIDDAAFAEQWVQSRHSLSGKGKQALAQELRRKGVSHFDAASALAAITADDEEQRATELVRRKLRTMPANLDRDKTIRRLVAMLARRGYNQSTAFTVVKAELAQAQFDARDPD
ncbi:recombination regulator RecX [Nocardia sp. CA-135953]|uniref:recombination regulator RecX n=1 Tax=Nocardia sp. CA-135953 TaxID=3239978 RepID=UPI003D98660B